MTIPKSFKDYYFCISAHCETFGTYSIKYNKKYYFKGGFFTIYRNNLEKFYIIKNNKIIYFNKAMQQEFLEFTKQPVHSWGNYPQIVI